MHCQIMGNCGLKMKELVQFDTHLVVSSKEMKTVLQIKEGVVQCEDFLMNPFQALN